MTAFQIDGSDVKDPIDFAYEERFTPFRNANGRIVVSAYYSAVASFNVMTSAQYALWIAEDDGLSHSIKCPHPESNTYTTFTGVRIQRIGGDFSTGIYAYDMEFRITRINTLSLPAFGA